MKSVVIAMVLGIIVTVIGWTFYAKHTEKIASERGIVTQDAMYKK